MQFEIRNATGKAGENLVEQFIERKLGFVYRKVNAPDIGVDGEIEILKQNRHSTGGLIKVQVKTTQAKFTGPRVRVGLDEAHLDYFSSLTVPVILAVVSLANDKIWWKPILHKEVYIGPRGGFAVIMDRKSDRLKRTSRTMLSLVGNHSNAIMAKYLVGEVEEQLGDIQEMRAAENFDYVTMDIWAETIVSMEATLAEAHCLLKYERRYSTEISAIEERYVEARSGVSDLISWFSDVGYADILAERRAQAQ